MTTLFPHAATSAGSLEYINIYERFIDGFMQALTADISTSRLGIYSEPYFLQLFTLLFTLLYHMCVTFHCFHSMRIL